MELQLETLEDDEATWDVVELGRLGELEKVELDEDVEVKELVSDDEDETVTKELLI